MPLTVDRTERAPHIAQTSRWYAVPRNTGRRSGCPGAAPLGAAVCSRSSRASSHRIDHQQRLRLADALLVGGSSRWWSPVARLRSEVRPRSAVACRQDHDPASAEDLLPKPKSDRAAWPLPDQDAFQEVARVAGGLAPTERLVSLLAHRPKRMSWQRRARLVVPPGLGGVAGPLGAVALPDQAAQGRRVPLDLTSGTLAGDTLPRHAGRSGAHDAGARTGVR